MHANHAALEKAMVMDNDAGMCALLADFLNANGFDARVATDPGQALRDAEEQGIALAFVGVNLDGMDGLNLARRLKETDPDTMVVMIADKGSYGDAVEAIRIGAYDYLHKPLSTDEIALALERYRLRRNMRKRLHRAERRHSLLLQNVPVLIFSLKPDLNLAFINQAATPMLGFERSEISFRGMWIMGRIHPDDRPMMRRLFTNALARSAPFSAEFRMVHKQGQTIHSIAKTILAAPGDEDNGERRLECVAMDITDRVLLEQRMVQDEKLKTLGAITAEVAHEIRNPLTAVGGFARRLQKKAPDLVEVDIILRESLRLEKLLDRISNYLAPVKIRRTPCHVSQILFDSVIFLSPHIDEQGVWPDFDIQEGMPPVYADPDVLRQVFINLTLSSLKTIGRGQDLTVSATARDGNVSIRFISTLAGEESFLNPDTVFMPFAEGGENIGLSLSYRLVKHLNGVLTYERDGDNGIFSVTLPAVERDRSREDGQGVEVRPSWSWNIKSPSAFAEIFEREWGRAQREVRSLTLMFAEMNHYAEYLDCYGSKSAQSLAEKVGAALYTALKRPADVLAHYSDTTFAAILPGAKDEGAAAVAEEMRRAVDNLGIIHEKAPVTGRMTVSVGHADIIPHPDVTPQDLISDAYEALGRARESKASDTAFGRRL